MKEDEGDSGDAPHPPRWVPYTPPPPDGWDRIRLWARRLSFPIVLVLLAGGVAGVVYWTAQTEAKNPDAPQVNVLPSIIGMGEGAERAMTGGTAPLLVRSRPPGATVRINGDSVGVTPLADSAHPAGVYMVSVQREGHFRADTVVVVEKGRGSNVRLSLRRRPGYTGSVNGDEPASTGEIAPSPKRTQAKRPAPVTSVPTPAVKPRPTPAPVFGALYVTSAPPGAVVYLNGAERGRTPVPLSRVPPGPQRVSMSLDGYEPWTARVEVAADSIVRVHAPLQQRTGRLRVLARPWGTIYVDGTLHARESDVWYETTLPEGRHEVTVVHPALGERTRHVGISAGQETEVVIDLGAQGGSDGSP